MSGERGMATERPLGAACCGPGARKNGERGNSKTGLFPQHSSSLAERGIFFKALLRKLPVPRSPVLPFSLMAAVLALPQLAHAQREPVLKQIQLPHNYYYREMYLPQLTSGPSGVTWSPDGTDLIYSMQGSLWRQHIGDSIAYQLTAGPGYDYQPDWSPNGRYVAYASYRNDAIELWLLEVETLDTRPLLATSAVNLEPRWSPDGRRLAYVSSVLNGRWQIFTMEVTDGRPGTVQQITDEHDSGLPRYYYSKYDHYISPTWSPDGAEIIFVSNRNHIWGSGGFWRMAASPSAEAREIHYEETTWKARPDWSRDGKRVVYSSYLGRQWNQLWLMTADGSDPFQLTYGDFDATAPRWSFDSRHIAYISNESGNTSLWVLDVPGSRRREVVAGQRVYRKPMGRLRLSVVDHATGKPIPARVSVTGPDGRNYAPDGAWRHGDDGFDRQERDYEYQYFHTPGTSELAVPSGRVAVEVSRGLEYRVAKQEVTVAGDSLRQIRVTLERLANLPAAGWWSGDLHIHMNYGGTYRNRPGYLAFQARAEDLHVVEDLIVNKEGRIPDVAYFTGKVDPVSSATTLIRHDQEFHTSYWGHTGLLGLTRNLLLPDYVGYVNTAAASLYPSNATVIDLAHAQGGIGGYVHPFDSYPEPSDSATGLTNELPIDAALGRVDYYEVVGFSDHMASARVWYQLLNCGFRIPAGAGTDAMANFASLRGPVGVTRVFVNAGRKLDYDRWIASLRAGKTFATNGPLLDLSVNGQGIGSVLNLSGLAPMVTVTVGLKSIVPVDHLEVVQNGEVVASVPLGGTRTSASVTLELPVERSGWLTLRAWSDHATPPVLDIYPFATTSPIYLTVGGKPARSSADAAYFLAWIDRLEAAARASTAWNTEAEAREVLRQIEAARLIFRGRL